MERESGQAREPVKPLGRIRDEGKDALGGTNGQVVAVGSIFDQRKSTATRTRGGRWLREPRERVWGKKGEEKGEQARWGEQRLAAVLLDDSGVLERAVRARAAGPEPVA